MIRPDFFHIIEASFIGPTNTKEAHVRLYSPRFDQTIRFPFVDAIGNTYDNAIHWLNKRQFEITGGAEGKDKYYIITKTFKNLK